MSAPRKGKGSNKTSSANNNGSTSNAHDISENSGFTQEQLALYKAMCTKMEAQKKAAAAAEDEGMWILIYKGCLGS